MCLFVTMTLPRAANLGAASDALKMCGRQLVVLEEAPAIAAGETYFLVSGVSCDCSTSLGEARRDSDNAAGWIRRHENRRKAMEKKGWSKAKIARAMADLEGAHKGKVASINSRKGAEIAQWCSIVHSVPKAAGADYVGLMLHQYSGAIGDEQITARREVCSPDAVEDFLMNIEEDVLYEFRLSTSRRATERAQ